MGAGWVPPYPDPLFDPRKEIIHLTEQLIHEAAAGGNVVVVGRGAGFVLRENPAVFRVFLRAPQAVRIRTLMDRLGLTEAEAKRKMHETDSNRAAYIHQLYGHDWCDIEEYDLMVNTGRIGYQATAELILRGAAEKVASVLPKS
jgi:cytidylate kinase